MGQILASTPVPASAGAGVLVAPRPSRARSISRRRHIALILLARRLEANGQTLATTEENR